MGKTVTWLTVTLSPQESAKLKNLAEQTERSQGGVIRRLLGLADLPEGRRLLGIIEPITEGVNDPQEARA